MSLDIADGEFVILVGPSGCGKSTLLRMIVGLEDITEGELRIDGKRVNESAPRDRDLAMVFQNYALYPHLSVYDNIAFPDAAVEEQAPPEDDRPPGAPRLVDAGVDEHLERKPGNLSGGQRQRVAMGRAIVREADAFLFDEPLSNLDAKLRGQMRTQIAQLQRRLGITSVCHPRPDRGDDPGGPGRGAEEGWCAAVKSPAAMVLTSSPRTSSSPVSSALPR